MDFKKLFNNLNLSDFFKTHKKFKSIMQRYMVIKKQYDEYLESAHLH